MPTKNLSILLFLLVALAVCLPGRGAPASLWSKYNQEGLKALESKKFSVARALFNRALREAQIAGQNTLHLAVTTNNLGLLCLNEGKYSQAEALFKQAIALFEKAHKSDHPDTATAVENLARLYWHQNKIDQAEPLMQRFVSIDQKTQGPGSAHFAGSLDTISDFYMQQGWYDEAQPYAERALAIRENLFGRDNDRLIGVLNKLAIINQQQGKYDKAELLFKRAMAVAELRPGTNDPDAKILRDNYADLQKAIRQPNLMILKPVPGETLPDTPIVIRVQVDNFQLVTPEPIFGTASPKNLGHIHYILDEYPLVATSAEQLMMGKEVEGHPLPKGKHQLYVELVHDTHDPLSPPVRRRVSFYTRY